MFKKKTDSLLTIDLAPDSVRVLDVALRRNTPAILSAVSEKLADGGIDSLPERHIAALEKLLNAHKLRRGPCVAAVPTNLVTTRSVLIDPSKPGTREDQIKQTLQNILTCDAKDLLFDFWNVSDAAPKAGASEVLVVACQRSVIHRYLEGFAHLKLSCDHLDVAPCALASLIAHLMPEQESMVGTVTLGDTLGYFAVVEKQRVLFWRPFEMPPAKLGGQAGLERVGHEISKCVSHMLGAQHLDSLGEIIVFGNNARDEQFASYLAHRFNLRVRAPSPFDWMAADAVPAGLREPQQADVATHFAAALGLALQPVGGHHG